MQMRHAEGYILAVALFLVCCWVNPNDATPHRTRPQAKEQVDHWVGNRAETKAVNVTRRAIGQPDVGADEISDLSGGGTNWTTSQRLQSHRSRIKNLITNANMMIERANLSSANFPKINQWTSRLPSNVDVATQHAPKTDMDPAPIAEAINCSEPLNANDRYPSSFNGNCTTEILNAGDESEVAGEAGTKKNISVLVGEDVTLCWIETTTIKEDRSSHPVQRFVTREYTISFEDSAVIPERYLECVQLKGEIDTKNNSIPRSTLFEIMDENTRQSRVVNFTTVSHSDDLTVWQHRRVRCGVGPVVAKNNIEWADERAENTKERVEIKVRPKIHTLTAQPIDTEPLTNLSSPVDCGPGITVGSYSDCVDGNCGYYTTPSAGSTSPDLQEVTTQSYMTSSAAGGERDRLTDATDDHESNELLSTGGMKESLLVTDKMIDSSEEMTTPILVTTETTQEDEGPSTVALMEVATNVDDESGTTTLDDGISNSTESSAAFSTTIIDKTNNSMEIGNQEVEMSESSEEKSLSASEIDDSCENDDLCADSVSDDLASSLEDASNSEMEFTDTVTQRDDEIRNTEDFTTTPTTDASELTTEHETYYLSKEEWETTTRIAESKSTNPMTETIENNATSVGVTEDSNTVTEIMGSGSTITETAESSTARIKAMSKSPNSKHKLALKIKILLEHIDENENKQKLVEVEKHLLFNVETNEHGKQSLIKQIRSLNNTVSMQTVQALFNCSPVEGLTDDASDFAAKCFTLHDETPHDEEPKSDLNSTEGTVHEPRDSSSQVQRDVGINVEKSLLGVHDDIHAGLSHVMTRVPPEHEVEQQNVEMSEDQIPPSRLLEVVADPRDERVHARKRRQTFDDLTIDPLDLPKDLEEVGHWSNERVRRAIDSGHIRTLTEFTIYEDP